MLQIKNYHDSSHVWLPMVGSQATGLALVKNDFFGADMLRFKNGQKTSLHTHPGDHVLFVVEGSGWLIYDGQEYALEIGVCYFVPGNTPHQVGSGDAGMILLSVGNNHRPVDSEQRLEVLEDV